MNTEKLEKSFSELCHVIGNKNLGNLLLAEKLLKTDLSVDALEILAKIVFNCREVAKVTQQFKNDFVEFRENDYK